MKEIQLYLIIVILKYIMKKIGKDLDLKIEILMIDKKFGKEIDRVGIINKKKEIIGKGKDKNNDKDKEIDKDKGKDKNKKNDSTDKESIDKNNVIKIGIMIIKQCNIAILGITTIRQQIIQIRIGFIRKHKTRIKTCMDIVNLLRIVKVFIINIQISIMIITIEKKDINDLIKKYVE